MRPDVEDPPADPFDDLVVEPEDRGHRAGVLLRRLGHRQATLAYKPDRLFHLQGARRSQRRKLADRVTDDEVGLDPTGLDRLEDGCMRTKDL